MIFLKKFRLKKILSLLSFAFIFLSLPDTALAAVWTPVVNAVLGIPAVLVGFVLGVIALLSHMAAVIAGALLNWVTSPGFISWSYTQPANNPVIEIGLSITKNFVNLGLVVILVFIAFSIALRLKEYATQKTLIRLIAIALLVNFAPVICGLIVDASNIVMNYFLIGIEQGVGGILTGVDVGSIVTDLGKLFLGGIAEKASILTKAAVMIVLNISIAFAFLLFAVILLLRYIAIWLLVILAPLAFVAWILPATRKFWDMWWNQFIQWSIIGIPIAFFLYLAMVSFGALSTAFRAKMTIPGLEPEITGLLDMVFPYFLVLALMWLGLVMGLKTSAMGASSAISLTKKAGKGSTGWLGKQIAKRGIRPALEKVGAKEAVGKISKGIEKIPGVRWFLPEAVRKYGQMMPAIEKAKERAKSYSSGTLAHRILKKADIQTDATAGLMTVLERGDSQDIFVEAKKLEKWKGKSDQEISEDKEFGEIMKRPLDIAQKAGKLGNVLRTDPRLAKVAAAQGIGPYQGLSKQAAVRKALSEARAQHISNWEPEVFEDKNVITAALGQFDRERWLQINRTIKNGQRFSLKGIDTIFTEFADEKGLAHETDEEKDKAWEEFRKHIKEQNQGQEGYFKALEDKRIRNTGWRPGEYGGAAPLPTPGEAAGIPKPKTPRLRIETEEEELKTAQKERRKRMKEEE